MQINTVFLVLALGVTSILAQAGDQPDLKSRQLNEEECVACHKRCQDARGKQSRAWLIDCYNGCKKLNTGGGPCRP
ncbi:hypothetical protein VTL71DRAFT_1118 [Oculimacula yallundae]|uniref:Uncharacterized protein n=1 Tax=Oculimacula yallundae TaxID=86028 RepID=A0ABR4D260_9HELO